jgi:uncharacterized cupredoxin-like copper-binding protein
MRRFVVVALAPVLVIAAGCGSSSNSSKSSSNASTTPAAAPTTTAATSAPGAVAIGVRETEYKLTPANVTLPKSGKHTVLAINAGKITHAIEVEGGGAGGADVKSSSIAPGQSATIAVDLKAGKTYSWYCPIDGHKGLGMKGTIKVAGSSASASAAPKTTTSSGSSGGASTGSSGGSSGGGYGY